VNGFNLGRYWMPQGPQQTLYVPGPRLLSGKNELVVLELHNASDDVTAQFVGEPMLRKAPKSMRCDPTIGAVAGAASEPAVFHSDLHSTGR
jgi:hypothetical protein